MGGNKIDDGVGNLALKRSPELLVDSAEIVDVACQTLLVQLIFLFFCILRSVSEIQGRTSRCSP